MRQLEEYNDLTSQVYDVDATAGNSNYKALNSDDCWVQWIWDSSAWLHQEW